MTAINSQDLPPIAVLIVDGHSSSARQLAKLLRLWGAARATTVTTLAAAAESLEQDGEPTLVLLDGEPGSYISPVIALWIASRDDIRRRTVTTAYTNFDQGEVKRKLRRLRDLLRRDPQQIRTVLGLPSLDHHSQLEPLLARAQSDEPDDLLYQQLYSAHLSKQLSIDELRVELQPLAALVASRS